MYPPLTSELTLSGIGVDIWLLGLSFIEVSAIAAAVELIVGVLKCRPPGMRINLIPLYPWYVLVVAGMILFAFPPLIAGDLLLELERTLGWPFFDATEAATRYSGSTCSGSSAIPRCTSSFCRRLRWSR